MGLFSKLKSSASNYNNGPPPYSVNSSANYAPPSPPQQHNENPDQRPLPQGWISQYDPKSGKFFYVYTPNSTRQWEHPSDKSLNNKGERNSYYQQQQPYPQQSYQQPYAQQQYQQPPMVQQQYQQPPMVQQQPPRFGGGGNGGGYGKMAAAGIGGGLLGLMAGDALGHTGHTDVYNYYDNDYNNYDNDYNNYDGDYGGGLDGGFDGGFDQVDF